MYDNGWGVRQDYQTALKRYRLAADQGDANAQMNLGIMHGKGQGVKQDYKTSVKWYTLAAKQGYAKAQNNLGVMYGLGQGVSQDYVTAHMWANIAAVNGSEMAPELRNAIAKRMTPAQIHAAQKRTKDCVAKNYKDC
jgi:TPR repeat protein